METFTVKLTKDEINHILDSFDYFGTATLCENGVQLEDSINEKLAKALESENVVEINMPDDFKIEQIDENENITNEEEVVNDNIIDEIGTIRTAIIPVDTLLSECKTEIPDNVKEEIMKNAKEIDGKLMVEIEIENLGPNEENIESDNSEIVAEKIPGAIEEVSEEISEAIEELKINEPVSSNNESDSLIEDEVGVEDIQENEE